LVYGLVGGGLLAIPLGIVLVFLLGGAGGAAFLAGGDRPFYDAPILGVWLAGLGLVSILAGAIIGLRHVYGNDSNAPVETIEPVYIIGKFVNSKRGEEVFDPDQFDPEDLRHFVRVQLPQGQTVEYSTSAEVFDTVMEGAQARIQVQGKWLGAFTWLQKPADPITPYIP
jgi:hypothetical protein